MLSSEFFWLNGAKKTLKNGQQVSVSWNFFFFFSTYLIGVLRKQVEKIFWQVKIEEIWTKKHNLNFPKEQKAFFCIMTYSLVHAKTPIFFFAKKKKTLNILRHVRHFLAFSAISPKELERRCHVDFLIDKGQISTISQKGRHSHCVFFLD